MTTRHDTRRNRAGRSAAGVAASFALLALALLAGACRRNDEGKIVVDEPKAKAETEKAEEATREGLAKAGDATKEAVAKAGEVLDSSLHATGQALDRAGQKLEPRVADAAVTARVKGRLLADPEVNGLEIDVDTVNGVVTLNGRVATAAQRDEAVKLARGTEGVTGVNDLLQVVGGG